MSADVMIEGQVCKPNISAGGRRMRKRFGAVSIVIAVAFLGWAMATQTAWYVRLLVFLPAAGAAFGYLQVSRNTCVARAREGTFEHDDLSKTKAPDDEVAASRKVAATINRDGFLIGLAAAAFAAVTTFIR